MTSNNNVKGFLFGFLAGGATGAIVALLTTPKSGKELRGEIKQKSGEYLEEADKYYQEKKIKAGEMLNEGKRKYAMMMDDLKSKPEEILKDAKHVYNDAKSKTNDVLHFGKEKLDDKFKTSVTTGMNAYNDNKKS